MEIYVRTTVVLLTLYGTYKVVDGLGFSVETLIEPLIENVARDNQSKIKTVLLLIWAILIGGTVVDALISLLLSSITGYIFQKGSSTLATIIPHVVIFGMLSLTLGMILYSYQIEVLGAKRTELREEFIKEHK